MQAQLNVQNDFSWSIRLKSVHVSAAIILLNLIIFASSSTLLYKGRRCQLRRGRFNSSTCSNFVECIVQRREHFDIGLCLCVVVVGLG